jgi:exopolysaccharide biosynthesis polyprenyl glycosylphosphotransferase
MALSPSRVASSETASPATASATSGSTATGDFANRDFATGPSWSARYSRRLVLTDLLAVTWAIVGTQFVRFGFDSTELATRTPEQISVDYSTVSIVLIALWMAVLAMFGTRDHRIVGAGAPEYKRVLDGALLLFAGVTAVAFVFQIDVARGYVLIGLPVGLLAILATRWCWRQWLLGQRVLGNNTSSAIVIGSVSTATTLALELAHKPDAGFTIVGACLLGNDEACTVPWNETLPVAHGLDDLEALLHTTGADTVIVTSTDQLPPDRMRALSWSLEPGRHHLIIAPTLADVGGPRIHMRPVAGLPLLHIETPRLDGFTRFAKRAFDIAGSLALLTVLAPLFVVLAAIIKTSSPGPIFYHQQRVGIGGTTFTMWKFRTMVVDAEARLAELENASRDAGNSVLFKLKGDPRITAPGRLMRRFSLDELPQLLNVLTGSMSLVGPRPPLAREVALYEKHMHRRFFVQPGITGLWQVSGRSTLSWDESVRIDLYYVENWSLIGDIIILWRTFRAVVCGVGAF